MEIKDVAAEACVISSVLLKPELIYYSEHLKPNHFTVEENAWLYWAVRDLVTKGHTQIDTYSVVNTLYKKEAIRAKTEKLITVTLLNELFEDASEIARVSNIEYVAEVDKVIDCAIRRDVCKMADELKNIACNKEEDDIEGKAYTLLDSTMAKFSLANELPEVADIADEMLEKIMSGKTGIEFKWPALNDYVRVKPGELVIFGAGPKQGKSMLLLNETVDLLKKGYAVLYIDSELNTQMFMTRMFSHLAGIEYRRLEDGVYSQDELERLMNAKEWLKTKTLTHLYVPIFDEQTVYTTTKRLRNMGKLDILVVDYFKSSKDEAYANYAELGRFVDLVKISWLGH